MLLVLLFNSDRNIVLNTGGLIDAVIINIIWPTFCGYETKKCFVGTAVSGDI